MRKHQVREALPSKLIHLDCHTSSFPNFGYKHNIFDSFYPKHIFHVKLQLIFNTYKKSFQLKTSKKNSQQKMSHQHTASQASVQQDLPVLQRHPSGVEGHLAAEGRPEDLHTWRSGELKRATPKQGRPKFHMNMFKQNLIAVKHDFEISCFFLGSIFGHQRSIFARSVTTGFLDNS